MKVEIPLKLPSLNEYINKCRYNRYAGNNFKQQVQNDIAYYLKGIGTFTSPVYIKFTWYEQNMKRDLDNIAFAKKFVLDTMVSLRIILNDNHKYLIGLADDFVYGAKEYKVVLEILTTTQKLNEEIDLKGILKDVSVAKESIADLNVFADNEMNNYIERDLLNELGATEKRNFMKKLQIAYDRLHKLEKYLRRKIE